MFNDFLDTMQSRNAEMERGELFTKQIIAMIVMQELLSENGHGLKIEMCTVSI